MVFFIIYLTRNFFCTLFANSLFLFRYRTWWVLLWCL